MKTLYFISDLHIGGDEALGVCDFEDELVEFISSLADKKDEDIELLIVGDAFGLWEFTQIEGAQKLDALIDQFPRIFETFRREGKRIRISLLAGNHDYELACYPEFVDRLAEFSIKLEQSESITRTLGIHKVWIEHGSQHDAANRSPDYGNPHAQPIGYFITKNTVGSAGRLSERGRYNWLKDIQSVYPTEDIPHWVLSNYFYREMSPLIRWVLLPFMLFFGVSLFVLGGAALNVLGFTSTNVLLDNRLLASLGIVGSVFQFVVLANIAMLLLALVLSVPLSWILRDLRKTAARFGLTLSPAELAGQKEEAYLKAAEQVFEEDSSVSLFVYGHTHAPSVRMINERAVVNTGTWIKKLHPVKSRFKLLPSVYVPSYRLNYFRVDVTEDRLMIQYHVIKKEPSDKLTWIQRLATPRNYSTAAEADVPAITVVDA